MPDSENTTRCLLLLTEHPLIERPPTGSAAPPRGERIEALVDAVAEVAKLERVDLRLWLQVDDDPLRDAFGRAPFGAVIDLAARDATTLLGAVELVQLPEERFDLAESSAISGQVHTLDPGESSLGLMFAMNAKDDMTSAQFHDYWLNEHAPNHAHRSGTGYQQLHGSANDSRRIAEAARVGGGTYDGVALAVVDELPQPGGGRPDRGDRENFVDPTTEVGMILERVG